jgi:hypothetical protein
MLHRTGDWDAMEKTSASKLLSIGIAIALVTAIGLFLVDGKRSANAPVDQGVTTGTAAAAAGAKVIPSEPQPRVEPK